MDRDIRAMQRLPDTSYRDKRVRHVKRNPVFSVSLPVGRQEPLCSVSSHDIIEK